MANEWQTQHTMRNGDCNKNPSNRENNDNFQPNAWLQFSSVSIAFAVDGLVCLYCALLAFLQMAWKKNNFWRDDTNNEKHDYINLVQQIVAAIHFLSFFVPFFFLLLISRCSSISWKKKKEIWQLHLRTHAHTAIPYTRAWWIHSSWAVHCCWHT